MMNNKINGRTPEEIKQGLEYCIGYSDLAEGYCAKCLHAPDPNGSCRDALENDAVALIEHLEEERDQYKYERDVAVSNAKSKRNRWILNTLMWFGSSAAVGGILIYLSNQYDMKVAVLAFLTCVFGIILKDLYDNDWEEDDEAQD